MGFEPELPFHEQVANVLRSSILSSNGSEPIRLPTERDLCTIHGVSRITIRRAMETLEREGLVERTRSRGTLTIPEGIARWKRRGKDRIVQILTTWQAISSPDSFYGRICAGIRDRLRQNGYTGVIQKIKAPHAGTAMDLRSLDKDTTLGVIFVGFGNEVMVKHYTDAGLPVVCVDYWTTNPKADAVVIDCFSEGQTATEFLLRQGHTQLVLCGPSVQSTQRSGERLRRRAARGWNAAESSAGRLAGHGGGIHSFL